MNRRAAQLLLLGGVSAPSPFADYTYALDFAAGEYWNGGVQAASLAAMPGYSFTRTGTQGAVDSNGTIDSFADNVPAINGNGYHAYPALTNPLLRSSELDNASWAKSAVTVSANQAISPDGTTTLDKIIPTTAAARHHVRQNHGFTGTAVTFSVSAVVEADGFGFAALGISNGAGTWSVRQFNLATGAEVGDGWALVGAKPTAAYSVNLGGGLWRLVVTFVNYNVDAAGAPAMILMATSGGDPIFENVAGNAVDSILAGHLQALLGNFIDGGPLIATAGATASIGASTLNLTVTALADAEQLIFATGAPGRDSGGNASVFLYLQGATSADYVFLQEDFAGNWKGSVNAAGVAQANVSGGAATTGQKATILCLRKAGTYRFGKVVGGVLTWFAAAAAGNWPTGLVNVSSAHLSGGSQLGGPCGGVFIRPGSYPDDASILAAVAETAA